MASTSTSTSTSTSKGKKNSKISPKLTNSKAIAFWDSYWKGKTRVDNSVFQNGLEEYLAKHTGDNPDATYNKDEESRRIFAMTMTNQIFWPACDLDGQLYPAYVDQSCIQFAINTFGLWSTLFHTIHVNLEDTEQPLAPLQYFHGRTPKDVLDAKLSAYGNFAIRYGEDGGLVMSWARPGKTTYLVTRDEKIRRRKLKGKKGKKAKIVWTWEEVSAGIGGRKTKSHNFKSLGDFITYKKGGVGSSTAAGIKDPIMFASAYKTFEPEPNSSAADEVAKAFAMMDG